MASLLPSARRPTGQIIGYGIFPIDLSLCEEFIGESERSEIRDRSAQIEPSCSKAKSKAIEAGIGGEGFESHFLFEPVEESVEGSLR